MVVRGGGSGLGLGLAQGDRHFAAHMAIRPVEEEGLIPRSTNYLEVPTSVELIPGLLGRARGVGTAAEHAHPAQHPTRTAALGALGRYLGRAVQVSPAFAASFSACVSSRPFSSFSLRSEYRSTMKSAYSRWMRVYLANSSIQSTTRSRKSDGFMRPSSSNSFQALATLLWFTMQSMRIHRASRRSSFTTLKLWEPPFTCSTTQVRP
mmetsp:Transcript_56469/g.156112  ORF Transcript_56469/g.156112 Transcript_56469/m.156112 type:complete len:207 (-) Transcript_56469:1046-1666(-)